LKPGGTSKERSGTKDKQKIEGTDETEVKNPSSIIAETRERTKETMSKPGQITIRKGRRY